MKQMTGGDKECWQEEEMTREREEGFGEDALDFGESGKGARRRQVRSESGAK